MTNFIVNTYPSIEDDMIKDIKNQLLLAGVPKDSIDELYKFIISFPLAEHGAIIKAITHNNDCKDLI